MFVAQGVARIGAKVGTYVSATVYRSIVTVAVVFAASVAEAQVPLVVSEPAAADTHAGPPSARLSGPNAEVTCSTTWEGTNYVGECATSQEIADAIAQIDALKADVENDWDSARETCLTIEEERTNCMYDEEEESSQFSLNDEGASALASHRFASFAVEYEVPDGSTSGTSCMNSRISGPAFAPADAVQVGGCVTEGLAAMAGVGSWLAAHVGAHEVLVAGASKSGVAAAVAGLVLGAFTTGYGIGTWLECLAE